MNRKLKGVYLCAREHRLPAYDIDYNDIEYFEGINLLCSCEDVDVSKYDYIIATPPCNYYSRANQRRESSKIALATKHLLPYCLKLCVESGKPFLVENVLNSTLIPKEWDNYKFTWGQHTFWTNIFIFIPDKSYQVKQNKKYLPQGKRDNNKNVDIIINTFLETIHNI